MTAAIIAAVLGALGRLHYGGAFFKPTQLAYLWFWALGVLLLGDPLLASAIVAALLAIGWNPGHGSYVNVGWRKEPDNEDIRPLVRFITKALRISEFEAKRLPDGVLGMRSTVLYDMIGLSVRYGLQTLLAALGMAACNQWLGSDYALWYAAVGLLGGPLGYLSMRLPERGWLTHWRWFEALIGAALYAGLTFAA